MPTDQEYLQQIRTNLSKITLPPWEVPPGGYLQMPIVAPKNPKQIVAVGFMVFPKVGGPVAMSLWASPELAGNRPTEDTPDQAQTNADFIAQAPSMIQFLLNYIDAQRKDTGDLEAILLKEIGQILDYIEDTDPNVYRHNVELARGALLALEWVDDKRADSPSEFLRALQESASKPSDVGN